MTRTVVFYQLIVGGVFLFLQNQPTPINPDRPLDVCTVLQNLQEYRGKIIAIRGRFAGSDIEGDCEIPKVRELNRFGEPYNDKRIVWVHPNETMADDWPEWSEDGAVKGAVETYDQLMRQGHNVQATFVGRLETSRTDNRAGYGHMAEYRAQLVLVTIRDVVSETGKPVRKPPKAISIDPC